jgi:hypothetical protein
MPQLEKTRVQDEDESRRIFMRAHTHGLLRRYLYASIQTCRIAPTMCDSIGRGWVSSRVLRTFVDVVIFVRDIEKCIKALPSLDRDILKRIVIQEHTQAEAASLLGMSTRTIATKLPAALDRLTAKLIEAEILILPE